MAMTLMDMLTAATQGAQPQANPVQQAGSAYGLNPQQSQQAISALLPAISSAMKRNTQSPQGLAGLLGALQNGGHDRYLNDPRALQQNAPTEGNAILGHLFGSKDVSRNVAGRAAQQTGLPVDALKKMLPMVAMMAMGAMGKQQRGNSGLQGLIGSAVMGQLMGGVQGAPAKGIGGMLSGMLGGGAPAPQQQQAHSQGLGMLGGLLDMDGDGNAFDDVLGMVMNRR